MAGRRTSDTISEAAGHVRRKPFTWLPRLDSNQEPRKRLRLTRSRVLMTYVFYVYLLRSVADDGFYVGFSRDLREGSRSTSEEFVLQRNTAVLGN